MINRFKTLLLIVVSTLTLLVPAIAMPALVHADTTTPTGPIGTGLSCGAQLQFNDDKACADQGPAAETTVNNIIKLVINIFSVVVAIVAVVMIIIGGIKFVMSGGDSSAASSARNTVIYAIVGLVVVALAQILVRYVLGRVGGAAGVST